MKTLPLLLAAAMLPGLAGSGFAQAPARAPDASVTVTGPAPALRPYRINPGDELEVYVWGEERLQRQVKVLPDGTFSFPLAGRIEASGKLPSEVETVITTGLRSQYREQVPQVTVSVRAPTGLQFSVTGKVRAQGTFNSGRYVNVLEALAMAGGPSEFADLNGVTILRKQGERLVTERVRLGDALKGTVRENLVLPQIQTGDTVIVP